MTARPRRTTRLMVDDREISAYVTSFSLEQDMWMPTSIFGAPVRLGRVDTTVTMEGWWSEAVDQTLYRLADDFDLQTADDGPMTFRATFHPERVTRTAAPDGDHYTFVVRDGARLDMVHGRNGARLYPELTDADRRFHDEWNRQRREKQEAEDRARQLLLLHLSDGQRQEFERRGLVTETLLPPYGTVEVGPASVRVLDPQYPGMTLARYCLVPSVDYSPAPSDALLARLLLLRHDPARFFGLANRVG